MSSASTLTVLTSRRAGTVLSAFASPNGLSDLSATQSVISTRIKPLSLTTMMVWLLISAIAAAAHSSGSFPVMETDNGNLRILADNGTPGNLSRLCPKKSMGRPKLFLGRPKIVLGRPKVLLGRPKILLGRPKCFFGTSQGFSWDVPRTVWDTIAKMVSDRRMTVD